MILKEDAEERRESSGFQGDRNLSARDFKKIMVLSDELPELPTGVRGMILTDKQANVKLKSSKPRPVKMAYVVGGCRCRWSCDSGMLVVGMWHWLAFVHVLVHLFVNLAFVHVVVHLFVHLAIVQLVFGFCAFHLGQLGRICALGVEHLSVKVDRFTSST